jgi:uncharacterized protein (DUF433 family)
MSPVQIDPETMNGAPCFAGTRVPVKTLFDFLAHGQPLNEFLRQFPTVSQEQAVAVLELAARQIGLLPAA